MTGTRTVAETALPGLKLLRRGKVRDVYEVDDEHLLIVATDRISAFDCILPNGIPRKGEVLTQISHFWFEKIASLMPHHLLCRRDDAAAERVAAVRRRSSRAARMIVKRPSRSPSNASCAATSPARGWKEYQQNGRRSAASNCPPACASPPNCPSRSSRPRPRPRPGHDENISFAEAAKIVGDEIAEQARDLSLKIYNAARDYAATARHHHRRHEVRIRVRPRRPNDFD